MILMESGRNRKDVLRMMYKAVTTDATTAIKLTSPTPLYTRT